MGSESEIVLKLKDLLTSLSDRESGYSYAVSVAKQIIDGCESVTGWTAQDQAAALTTSTTHTHGTKSLSFAKSGVTGTTGYIDKTITAIDVDVYQTHAIIHTNFYVSDISDIAKTFIRIGTDSGNYFQYDHLVADMIVGWNDADYILTRPSSQTGDGADPSSLTYIAFGIEMNANADTLLGILIDNITVKRMLEVLSFAGVQIPPAVRNVVITDRNSNRRADVEADGAQNALHVKSNSLATEATLTSIKDTDGIKKITDALPAGTNEIGGIDILKIRGTAPTAVGKLDVKSADGDQLTLGAIADAVVAAGATGSVSAKLRRATQGLEDLKTTIVLAAGTNNIGDVDLASAIPAGTNNIGDVDIASALPAGTNIIGYVKDAGVSYTPVHQNDEQTTAQTDTILWDPTAGKKFAITDISVSVDTAMDVYLEDGTTTIYQWHFAANGGCISNKVTPYISTAADNNLTYTSSAAGKISIAVDGYEV